MAVGILAQILKVPLVKRMKGFDLAFKRLQSLSQSLTAAGDCSFETLWSILEDFLNLLPHFSLLLDGLDEATRTGANRHFVEKIRTLGQLENSRILLFSRDLPEIRSGLSPCQALEMSEDHISGDIVFFAKCEIERNPRLHAFSNDIIDRIEERAHGMFLWVRLMLEDLKSAKTRHILQKRLNDFPNALLAVYNHFCAQALATLENDDVQQRCEILTLLSVAHRPLDVFELEYVLNLKSFSIGPQEEDKFLDAAEDIVRLCWPLVVIKEHKAQLVHTSVRDFLVASSNETLAFSNRDYPSETMANTVMVKKCLLELCQPEHASLDMLNSLVQFNSERSRGSGRSEGLHVASNSFYSYACNNWIQHLIRSTPDLEAWLYLRYFLGSIQAWTWAESVIFEQCCLNVGPVVQARASLNNWCEKLTRTRRSFIGTGDIFSHFERLIQEVESRGSNDMLVLFMMYRMGAYVNAGGPDPYVKRGSFAKRCKNILGPNHSFTLRGEAEFALEKLCEGEFQAAEIDLRRVLESQRRLGTLKFNDLCYTQQYLAIALFRQMKFQEAIQLHRQVSASLRNALNPMHPSYVKEQIYLAETLAGLGKVDEALDMLRTVWRAWESVHGAENPITIGMLGHIAALHQKLRQFEPAEEYWVVLLEKRGRIFGKDAICTIDTAINLAVLLRETAREDEALSTLSWVEAWFERRKFFQRWCQIEHLRALIEHDRNVRPQAIRRLSKVLCEAQALHAEANTELLKIRMTLASFARLRNQSVDVSAFFIGLTEGIEGTGSQNQEAVIAEEALIIFRSQSLDASVEYLKRHRVRWRDRVAFNIPFGGPIAEIH